jgi:hypothetical protein
MLMQPGTRLPDSGAAQQRAAACFDLTVEIGQIPIRLHTTDSTFCQLLEVRYAGFVREWVPPQFEFDIFLVPPSEIATDDEVQVHTQDSQWSFQRGDFRAEWDGRSRRGWIRQSANPYSIDSALRIVHTLLMAREGGFLLHAASAIKGGRAFLFAGLSGAGKTTLSSLAPVDVAVLTDEISYVRPEGDGYRAFGTPFAGELARLGENVSAPLAAVYLLSHGAENRIESVKAPEAVRALLRNILFFAQDEELVERVFHSAFEFVSRVPIYRLAFAPDERVWAMIE